MKETKMGVHVPEKHLQHMKKLEGVVDLTSLTDAQLKNIKKYYETGATGYSEAMTKTLSRELWEKYAEASHPHIKDDYYMTHTFKNYKASHPIWTEVEQYLSLRALLDRDKYYINERLQEENMAELNNIKNLPPDMPVTLQLETELGSSYGISSYDEENDPVLKDMEKRLSKIVKNGYTAMNPENEGLQIINRMINREINEYKINYKGDE
jgi:hypothetical protein